MTSRTFPPTLPPADVNPSAEAPAMTEPREKEEDASGEPKQKSTRPPGRWNPFASLRMTISPDERMALLKLPRPLLPVEDFLTKEQRKKLVSARRRPVIIRSAVLAGAAVLGALVWWLWPSAPQRDVQREPVPPPAAPPTLVASPPPPPAARAVALTQPTAQRIPEPKAASSLPSEPFDRVPPKATVKPTPGRPAPLANGTSAAVKPQPARAKPSPSSAPAQNDNDFWTDQR